MNVQAHMSGQAPNQGTVQQNNGNSQMQNLSVASAGGGGGEGPSRTIVGPIDRDILRLRQYMRILVFKVLQQKQPPPDDDDASKAKYMEVARRLEGGLFKMANTRVREKFPESEDELETEIAENLKSMNLYS